MRYLTIIILLLFSAPLMAQQDQQLISLGNKLYKQQQFEKAAIEYQKAAELNNKNTKAQYNMGNAFFRSNKLDQAEKAFDAAAQNAIEDSMRSSAFYNKGVSLSQQKKLEESIGAYKNSLRINPEDEEARENLQKALNELKKDQQKQSPKNEDKKNEDEKDPKKDKPQQNKSKLNEKQAEQMLNALRQEEKAIQKDLQKNKAKSGSIPQKDW